jgi:cellulose synthase/poly-beta-1,6-N-acetylglucosamine synthase-like glycosyltransferase
MQIRQMESRFNSLVSASGSFFAVRKYLFRGYGEGLADDFALPLQVYRQGYRVIHRDDLIGYVPMVKSSGMELSRRSRIVEAGIRTVWANRSLLNPFRYPVFSWQLWSHKVLKWCFPFVVAASIILAMILREISVVYQVVMAIYGLAALSALIGFFIGGKTLPARPFRNANFLLISIIAVLLAWYKVLTGAKSKTWEPTHR